ncbi:N-6 DNA Methylase [Pedobacter steynii]|uniref:site-specific DNA-methyltransferase (adenine-specific) n=1 Tax=Pedobacter steynii TaxID=430522 RepID=A0A1G9UIR8_9SPHI|nr:N-6 DNA methylase [Pedobacter steynii]NQX40778.1 N-6 DNA methylase [Pedobacter steynii]SDM59733.1 N-6 DNA Methylase [Pedobacter steynii]
MRNVFKYLVDKGTEEANLVDKMIVSAFLSINKIKVSKNKLLRRLSILPKSKHYLDLLEFIAIIEAEVIDFNFEKLIEIFEFIISPSDRVVNGAVYTPVAIRTYIVEKAFASFDGNIERLRSADISCGCGGFLLSMTEKIRELTNISYYDIYRDIIFGIDIAEYSVNRSKILLSLNALCNGEDRELFEFNIYTGNSLIFDWRAESAVIAENNGFDIIVGNPPYVCSRNMDEQTREQVQQWEVAHSGHPDLYIPFFQIGLENLNANGILGYITVNTFIKSINGRALRNYFSNRGTNVMLLSFGGEQVFADRNTYTCICFLRNGPAEVNFLRTTSDKIDHIDLNNLQTFHYNELNHQDGWSLVNSQQLVDFINTVERTGTPFKDLYNTKNGIATLMNDVFKFKPIKTDEQFHYLEDAGMIFPIEIGVCKSIINANKVKVEEDLERLIEQIIFPYNEKTEIISKEQMKSDYPKAYTYLKTKKDLLSTRDKGKRKYEAWYAFGRRQSMDINKYKLFFPHICDRPRFVLCKDKDLLFYNGMAIVSNDLEELMVIKRIMESDLFFKYIKNTTKDYTSGYISMSRNYLKNFGVVQLDEQQKAVFLASDDPQFMLNEIYGIMDLV